MHATDEARAKQAVGGEAAWLAAAQAAFADIARDGLSIKDCKLVRVDDHMPSPLSGAFIPLVGGNMNVQFGIFSTEAGCTQLARRLLQLAPHEPAPSQRDVVDAVSELANMIGGNLKRRPQLGASHSALGLPIFLTAAAFVSRGDQKVSVALVQGADVEVSLVVLTPG